MTCGACRAAEAHPNRDGELRDDCLGCQARRLANSPMAFRAVAGDTDNLQKAIADIWKDDYPVGRKAVWDWMERIKAARRRPDP